MQLKQISRIELSSDKYKFEELKKNEFLKNILEALELKKQDYFDNNSIENKIKFKSFLIKNNLKILEDEDYMIFFKEKLIAKMNKPIYFIKKDVNKESKKQVYLEATILYETYLE